ncbi:MAG TPA: MmgE/PrpD family protein [Steroidobacteraceae bacterium]
MSPPSVTERLARFARDSWDRGIPDTVLHEANRLLINQLKASVGATEHPAIRILHDWAMAGRTSGLAHVLWLGTTASPGQVALVNGALFEVLDFNDTYIPCYMHAVSGVLPAALALAETSGCCGREMLTALALGIEIELACATILMPTAYFRGFVPGGITGAIGGAAACALLGGIDDIAMRNALGLAMNTGLGTYQSAGFMTLSYIMGMAAHNGVAAYELAARGFDAPRAAFEGDKGMLSSYSDESADRIESAVSSLGKTWRIHGQSYKTVPTETITHAPLECLWRIRERARGRIIRRLRFGVAAIVVKIADERMDRFGVPHSELTAKFDLRYCAAAAWQRGRFTLAEMREPAYRDPLILDLRSRIDLVADSSFQTFDGAALTAEFADGSIESVRIADFRGSPGNPLTDEELSQSLRVSAADVLPSTGIDAILNEAWSLGGARNVHKLMSLLRWSQT